MAEESNEKNTKAKVKGMKVAKLKDFFTSSGTRIVVGLICVCVGLFLLVSMISFLINGYADQSLIYTQDTIATSEIESEISNGGGYSGAFLSDILINKTFGVSSLLIAMFIIACGVKSLIHIKYNLFKLCELTAFGLVLGSVTLGFFGKALYEESSLYWGGSIGYSVAHILSAFLGNFFTCILLILVSAIVVIYNFPSLADKIMAKIKAYEAALAERNESEKEETQKEQTEAEKEPETAQPQAVEEVETETFKAEEIKKEPKVEFKTMVEEVPEKEEVAPANEEEKAENPSMMNLEIDRPEEIKAETEVPAEDEEDPETTLEIDNGVVDEAAENMLEPYDPTKDLEFYKAPSVDLLTRYPDSESISDDEVRAKSQEIIAVLNSFGVEIIHIKATAGPTVTLYELTPAVGVRISKIETLSKDIAMRLAADGIRIIAPMPGRGTVGVEVPNPDNKRKMVPMYDMLTSKAFQESKMELPMVLGKTISNEIFMVDLAKCPHVICAGATGQGKSVALNACITSLLYKKHPAELKFILIDPKMVEFSMYSPIVNHFMAKTPEAESAIITDVSMAVPTLESLCIEMDDRYELLKNASCKKITEYNAKFIKRRLNPQDGHRFLPYIVVIVDEFNDLIMTAGKEVEAPIIRITQKARAVGIHIIIATQRPDVKVLTGGIKANCPARFGLKTFSGIDSKVVLDQTGAENLIGRGDMLISSDSKLTRVQCAFIDNDEIERITEHISKQQSYPMPYILPEYEDPNAGDDGRVTTDLSKRDPKFEQIARYIVSSQRASTSDVQRNFEIGFNRSGKIMDQLCAAGIVGPQKGAKPREVLIATMEELNQKLEFIRNRYSQKADVENWY